MAVVGFKRASQSGLRLQGAGDAITNQSKGLLGISFVQ